MRFTHTLFAFWVLVASSVASGAEAPSVKVANAWARATVPGQNTGAAYVDLTSDRGAVLVAAGSPLAARVELHSMTNDGGVMRMRQLPKVDLPAGQTVKLEPNGVHLMLVDLKQALKPGDKLPLVLSVQSSGMSLTTLKIEAEVRAAASGAQHSH